ncbi:MAG TPA: hypothetical protein PK122_04755 [Candidatus Paceibacterota bacterium]|nr:hypothetical protein [Candidatus Paceibacterota bacterium]
MKYFEDIFQMQIQDLEFEGFRFSIKDIFSKKTKQELEDLVEDGSEFSSLSYKRIFRETQKAQIHVKLSFSFLFKVVAVALMVIAFISSFGASHVGFALMGMSGGAFLLSKFYQRRAKLLYIGFLSGPDIIDFMFEEIQKSRETK